MYYMDFQFYILAENEKFHIKNITFIHLSRVYTCMSKIS